MADEADIANRVMEQQVAQSRAYRRDEGRLQPRGVCHNCAETIARPKLFCDRDCADDFEWLRSRRGI